MYRVGQKEIDAVAQVIHSGKLFRYTEGGACETFEKRYGQYLDVRYVRQASSGTAALTAALVGLEIGPGDEVLVPACTYMATAIAVLAAGAIPVLVDVDASITMDPVAMDAAVGPRTRAVIPVHMWGLPCDMRAIMRVARKHKLKVIEDACQAVGGSYRGRKLGTIGHAGAYSFNFFKNMTCGEGGAVVTNQERVAQRASCMVDCCSFYWNGRSQGVVPFASNGSRASEIEGAMLNVQLDRIDGMIRTMRAQRERVLRGVGDGGLHPIPLHSPEDDCGTHVMFQLPSAPAAQAFAKATGGTILVKTGRHVYTEWDPILKGEGGHCPAMNPYRFAANKGCRRKVRPDDHPSSLDILGRTVMFGLHPDHTAAKIKALITQIRAAARSDG